MEKLTIQMLDGDYWDGEKNRFVIHYGDKATFPSDATIIDDDGVSWNCYLVSVKYYARENIYTAEFKPY